MAVIGFIQPFGSTWPIVEMQCRWVTRVLKVSVYLFGGILSGCGCVVYIMFVQKMCVCIHVCVCHCQCFFHTRFLFFFFFFFCFFIYIRLLCSHMIALFTYDCFVHTRLLCSHTKSCFIHIRKCGRFRHSCSEQFACLVTPVVTAVQVKSALCLHYMCTLQAK